MLFGFLGSAVVSVVALKQSAQLVKGPGVGQLHKGVVCRREMNLVHSGSLS